MKDFEIAFLENLYIKNFDNMYDIALRITGDKELALDAVQETFCEASNKISTLYVHPNKEGWLYKTLNNKIKELLRFKQHIKSNNNFRVIVYDFVSNLKNYIKEPASTDSYFSELANTEFIEKYKSILTEKETEYLKYKYIEEYSDTEIAHILNISLTAVSSMGSRIRKKIKKYYFKGDKSP